MSKNCNTVLPVNSQVSGRLVEKLYEDQQYIVFNKPTGLLVIPTPKNERATLVNIVNQQYVSENKTWKLHPCHRIDRETSGLIIFAKGKQYQKLMMDVFRQRLVNKKYIAFVHGRMPLERGVFRSPVENPYRKNLRKKIHAPLAITYYKVLKTNRLYSIVEVQPVTGRTNQIRIHFSQAGNPLVGDRKYAFARDYKLKFRRTALHASALEWIHPVSQRKICVKSDLPKDMGEFITRH